MSIREYIRIGKQIVDEGKLKLDRTGTGRWSIFGAQAFYDLSKGFPLDTTRFLNPNKVFEELFWILSGSSNNNDLTERGVQFWKRWARADGELGPIYGPQWRNWEGVIIQNGEKVIVNVDQIKALIDNLKNNAFSSRHVVSAWNPAVLPIEGVPHDENINNGRQVLPACHTLFQFFVERLEGDERVNEVRRALGEDGQPVPIKNALNWMRGKNANIMQVMAHPDRKEYLKGVFRAQNEDDENLRDIGGRPYKLSCQLYQRSADFPVGVPFNIASYAALTMMMAQVVGMVAGNFIHTFGDAHVYDNQLEDFKLQMQRVPLPPPTLQLDPTIGRLEDFRLEHLKIVDYKSHPAITYQVAV